MCPPLRFTLAFESKKLALGKKAWTWSKFKHGRDKYELPSYCGLATSVMMKNKIMRRVNPGSAHIHSV